VSVKLAVKALHKRHIPKKDVEKDWDKAYAPMSEEYGRELRDSFKLL
jgi:hypothetical protein